MSKVTLNTSKAKKCQFRGSWLLEKDSSGYLRSEWLKKSDNEHAFCSVCSCSIKFSSLGGQAISHHAGTVKHLANCRDKLSASQLRLKELRPASTSQQQSAGTSSADTSAPPTMQIYSVRRESVSAEIFWALKCVASDFSAASNEGNKELFKAMFPDSRCLENYSMSRTKFTYLLTDGLAPYFRDQLTDDLSGHYYTCYFDETTNEGVWKELQTGVRYWSDRHQKIMTAHLKTFFIGKADGDTLTEKVLSAIDQYSLPLKKIVMLGSDGPYVNAKVFRQINEKVKECRNKPLLDMGTCNLHIGHNAFSKGLEEFGEEMADLACLIYNSLDGWPSRWEDYQKFQADLDVPKHRFIKHLPSRWLTLGEAVNRVLEQWNALTKYFVDFIPAERPLLKEKVAFLRIRRLLSSQTTRAQLMFVRNSASTFASFTGFFQKEQPLIHVLHSELRTLALTLLNRICKPETISAKGVCIGSLDPDCLMPLEQVVIGVDVADELKRCEISEQQTLQFHQNVQKHIVAACRHLFQKSALRSGSVARYFRCLQPQRKSFRSCKDILSIAKALPVDVDINRLLDEWKLLQLENDEPGSAEGPVDSYWRQFFIMRKSAGDEWKYPNVTAVVKAALCLSHGQADVERGFSTSGRVMTSDRASMGERTLDAYLVVKNALKAYNNKPYLVAISNELVTRAEGAHAKHQAYLEDLKLKEKKAQEIVAENEKIKEEEAKRRASLDKSRKRLIEQEQQLKAEVSVESKKRKTGFKLLEEGNARLKAALKSGDLEEVAMAQAIIEAAQAAEMEAQSKSKEVAAMQKEKEKKKARLLSSLDPKK